MDFLNYGMKHRNSTSKLRRVVANFLLKIEIWKADLYEARLNKKHIVIPEDPGETESLLQAIWTQIEQQALNGEPVEGPEQQGDQDSG